MKHFSLILIVLFFAFSCNEEPKDYIKISGLIANNDARNIDIERKGYDKRIEVKIDGTFQDTLKVLNKGYYTITDGKNKMTLYLKNGMNIKIQYDYNDFENTIFLSGKGSETSTYLVKRKQFDTKNNIRDVKSFFKLNSRDFTEKVAQIENEMAVLLQSEKIDSLLKEQDQKRNKQFIGYLRKNYPHQHEFLTKLKTGNPSPKFENYESFKGEKVSLADFKGKYVYIDVWATWCGPCKREIPHLSKLVDLYKDKNIEFISISIDNGRGYKNDNQKAKEAWKEMIVNRKMNWLQLYADKAWRSQFIKDYGIRSIPRFILIDDNGNIVNANAPRPSNLALRQELDKLLN